MVGKASLIPVKALAAPILLEKAWQDGLSSGEGRRPWQSMDAKADAKLWVPRLGKEFVLLNKLNGQVLAFAPGVVEVAQNTHLVAGHKDTHFNFLNQLISGDQVVLEQIDRSRMTYEVTHTEIVSEKLLLGRSDDKILILTTCYPFTGLSDKDKRYAVFLRSI